MKTSIQKLISSAVLGLVLLSQSLPTWAGSTFTFDVQVGANYGRGPMTWARYSPDNQQYIGCSFEYSSSSPFITCSARDNTGKSSVCTSTNGKMFAAVRTITDSSIIHFLSNQGSPTCTYLSVTNNSGTLK